MNAQDKIDDKPFKKAFLEARKEWELNQKYGGRL